MKPTFEFITINIHDIDTDDTRFKIINNHNIRVLAESIRGYGLQNPPLLLKKKEGFCIISGFRRVEALKCTDIESIDARITECPDERACAQVAIMDNAFQRSLTLAEEIRSVKLMARYFTRHETDEEFFRTICDVLHIPMNKKYVMKLWKASTVSEYLMNVIENGRLSLDVALDVMAFEPEVQKKIALILMDYRISLSKQKELILWIREISVRDKCTAGNLLDDILSTLNQYRQISDMNARYVKVRSYLRQRRYPEMSKVIEKHEALISTLTIPNGMKFTVPDFFEGSHYSIQLTFKNIKELKGLSENLYQICSKPEMETILKGEYRL